MLISAASNLTSQFTGKERDVETGLDYFGARYYSAPQGRFMSPDPLGGKIINPQSFNRYSYVLNNPMKYTDPTGMYECVGTKCEDVEEALKLQRKSTNPRIARAAAVYGKLGDKNGVKVGFADLSSDGIDGRTITRIGSYENGKFKTETYITIDSNAKEAELAAAVGEEGSHAADGKAVIDSGLVEMGGQIYANQNITPYASEQSAAVVRSMILDAGNTSLIYAYNACGGKDCKLGKGVPIDDNFSGIVDNILGANRAYDQGGRPMSQANQGASVVQGVVGQVPKATVPR